METPVPSEMEKAMDTLRRSMTRTMETTGEAFKRFEKESLKKAQGVGMMFSDVARILDLARKQLSEEAEEAFREDFEGSPSLDKVVNTAILKGALDMHHRVTEAFMGVFYGMKRILVHELPGSSIVQGPFGPSRKQ